ncbi:UDP-N-acetyl-D-glucosamine dehydrogenase [Rhodococcus sp. SMB37]|uniref:nucleotide sugar dehydrogenase n=1 Tax=Rhodococcus sp. SMB37 TaxID=2512213 RepID=UPI0010E467AC|nr:nucleotide sugar dehydrogenase [Rhodococcus sp. SMB37]TCN49162.1 UDP-N-acetyl-D-glucosamine dehydrogenase [Rhodococcus sp. SMB37]
MPGKGKVVVVGQGYVGLPVAMRAQEVGYDVVGIDLDEIKVTSLESGHSYVSDISDEELQSALKGGRYKASSSYDAAAEFDVAVLTVPTPLRESLPDLSFIESAAISIASMMKQGSLVILESTTYPGTTEELLVPLLEQNSGMAAGSDFYVGYSPERIDPGNNKWGLMETPKVVSGVGDKALAKVREFYGDLVLTVVPVSSPKEAELAKLIENTFRHVNIALVNEIAVFANQLGVDAWEAIEAANTKPFGFMKFTPGPGVGGHCLPVDPSYLSWQVRRKLGKSFRFVELANDINDHMPDYVVQRLMAMLNRVGKAISGSKILIVGVAYKENTGDIREAPSIRIIDLLRDFGADVSAVDPYVERRQWPSEATEVSVNEINVDNFDAAVVVTYHREFESINFEKSSIPVLDTRRAVKSKFTEYL